MDPDNKQAYEQQTGLEFLQTLEQRLRYEYTAEVRPNMSGRVFGRFVQAKDFTDEKITHQELERLLGMMNQDDFAIEPQEGYVDEVEFAIYQVPPAGKPERRPPVLMFNTLQLPKGFNNKVIEEVYQSARNVELLKRLGIRKPRPLNTFGY